MQPHAEFPSSPTSRRPRAPSPTRFPRATQQTALDLPLRASIFAHVQREPGISIGELARATNSDYKTAQYHVRVLEKVGVVEERIVGSRVHVYEVGGAISRSSQAVTSVLRVPTRRALLLLAGQRPGLSLSAAARELNISKGTAHFHAAKLSSMGLLAATAPGLVANVGGFAGSAA